ncbi:hypothetical protein AMECASPLE_034423 [Ameca splendens]|uniref:Uncharacterized protein n=1 Tax=Ameca splendens TaxID=208324 RepID=A0ABV0XK29_9TELE
MSYEDRNLFTSFSFSSYHKSSILKSVRQSFSTTSSIICCWEAGAYLQQSMGRRQGRPWTGHQSIAGQHKHTEDKQPCTHSFTPKGNVERPINLTGMSLDCGRKLEYPERTHACTGRTCKLHAERPPTRSQTLAARRSWRYQLLHSAAHFKTSYILVSVYVTDPTEGAFFVIIIPLKA